MNNYFFDKRKMKAALKKYGAIFAGLFVVILFINYIMDLTGANRTTRIIFMSVFGVVFVFGIQYLLKRRQDKIDEQNKLHKPGTNSVKDGRSIKTVVTGVENKEVKTKENKSSVDVKENIDNKSDKNNKTDKQNKVEIDKKDTE